MREVKDMIGISCHSRNFGDGTPDEIFAFISKLGYEYIDVDSVGTIRQEDVITNPDKAADQTRELSEKYGIKTAEYFLGGVMVDGKAFSPSSPQIQLRDKMYANFDRICRYSKNAGFLSVMGSCGSLHKELGYERSFENAAEVLGKMVEIAAGYGMVFNVEPNRRSLLDSPQKAIDMVKRVEGLKYTVDFLHYQINGFAQEDTARLLKYAGHMHARQACTGWGKCPVEFGEIDYDNIIKRLRGLNWHGIIATEFWADPDTEAAGSSPIDQNIVMRYQLKSLIKKYY